MHAHRGIRQELQIVGRILVVRRHIQGHHALQKVLGGLVVRKQRVPLDVIEIAFGRMRAPVFERGGLGSSRTTVYTRLLSFFGERLEMNTHLRVLDINPLICPNLLFDGVRYLVAAKI